ncbi:MAG: 3-phenylpropionate/trans-cinnamate dioxygenase ferredoxin reductase component [Solirubrobacteraceae bacterium]|jgi:NADPH-dependent 2,4-dienoyl-CoA reductase/sulfur reductase-like enzyme|nr:3-phenylpropionate/trans-cinnamate dioxygenase ferredoxin reductase component [Solirubrobacteraceae bacterium]
MTGAPRRIVVVGGGVAAERCVHGLRERGFDGSVVMVTRERDLPYDRTLVSKDLLGAEPPVREASLQPAASYEERGIEVRAGTTATGVDVDARRLSLSDGDALDYDRLVICTGGEPVVPEALACPGVHVLRELRDARALREALDGCGTMAIVGGGFIGGEVASAAAARGIEVTLVEALEQPLARVVGPEVGARVADLHRRNGVEVLTGVLASGIRRDGARFQVALADGRTLGADAVVVGAGMRPATEWLADSPVHVDDGIVTDSACRTDVPGVLAAGDCARWWHPGYERLVRVEHWDTARRHGAAAAAAALDEGEPFAPLPFFWSDQHGVKLQWVGYAPAWDEIDIEDAGDAHGFVARFRLDGRLLGVFAAGQPRAIGAARRELQSTPTEVNQP